MTWCVVRRTEKRPLWPKPGEPAALGEGETDRWDCFLVSRPWRRLPVFFWVVYMDGIFIILRVPVRKMFQTLIGTFPGKKHKIFLRVSKNLCLMKTLHRQSNIFLKMGDLNSLIVYYWVPQSRIWTYNKQLCPWIAWALNLPGLRGVTITFTKVILNFRESPGQQRCHILH